MGMIGQCDDCQRPAHLRFKPDRPLDDQPRPSVCDTCRTEREQMLADIRHGQRDRAGREEQQ